MYTCYLCNTLEYINHDTVCVRVYYYHFAGYDTHKPCMITVTYHGDIITKENVVCCGSVHVQKYYKGLLCTGRAGQGKSIQPRGCIFYPSPNYPTMEHIYQSHCDIKYTVLVLHR